VRPLTVSIFLALAVRELGRGGYQSLRRLGVCAVRSTTNWDPYWSTSLFGSYSGVRYDGGANDNILGWEPPPPRSLLCRLRCQPSGSSRGRNAAGAIYLQSGLQRLPARRGYPLDSVKNLTFSAEVQWFHLDQKMSAVRCFAATAPKPTALYEFKDQDTFCCSFAPSVISDRLGDARNPPAHAGGIKHKMRRWRLNRSFSVFVNMMATNPI